MEKRRRLVLIRAILERETITDQEGLRARLEQEGVAASQSSLSRDLKNLGADRVRQADGTFAYRLPAERPAATSEHAFRERFAESCLSVAYTGVNIVLKTPPGEAQIVGRLVDHASMPGILGTLAGDDTVFCIGNTPQRTKEVAEQLLQILAGSSRPESASENTIPDPETPPGPPFASQDA